MFCSAFKTAIADSLSIPLFPTVKEGTFGHQRRRYRVKKLNTVCVSRDQFSHSLAQHRADQDIGIQNDRSIAHVALKVAYLDAFAR